MISYDYDNFSRIVDTPTLYVYRLLISGSCQQFKCARVEAPEAWRRGPRLTVPTTKTVRERKVRVSEKAVALESIIREWVTFIWTRGDSARTWGRDSGDWVRASTSADRGARAAAGRLRMIVDRFFDGLVCVSTLRLRGAGGLATRPETHGSNHKDCERGK